MLNDPDKRRGQLEKLKRTKPTYQSLPQHLQQRVGDRGLRRQVQGCDLWCHHRLSLSPTAVAKLQWCAWELWQ